MRDIRYKQIASILAEQIFAKIYIKGDKLPPIRSASKQFAASISTIQQAYRELEGQGLVEARPQSGYFVKTDARLPAEPDPLEAARGPMEVAVGQRMIKVLDDCHRPEVFDLGTAVLHPDFLPLKAIQRIIGRTVRSSMEEIIQAKFSTGNRSLRRQIAQRLIGVGCDVSPSEVIITGGCQDAFSLALNAVAKPGDTIAIESPTFAGLLQTIESLGMKALEIPTHPNDGISLAALALAIEQWSISACALIPAFNNPLGSSMSAASKRKLVELLEEHQIPLIEDDLFGDLKFSGDGIEPAKSFDADGLVLYCSSVSKSLGTGLRVGWICPGKYFDQVKYLRTFRNVSGPQLEQIVVAEIMATGVYDRQIRQLRERFARQTQQVANCVGEHFPAGTTVTRPKGGYVLWVGLPEAVNCWQLYELAIANRIGLFPGELFSASGKYRNFIRLNAAIPWNHKFEEAIARLGELTHSIAETTASF